MAKKAHESLQNSEAIQQLVPLLRLREAKNWATIGFKSFSKMLSAILIELYGRDAVTKRDCLNDFYSDAIGMREEGVQTAVDFVEHLLRYGLNYMTVDYYFSVLTIVHTFSLNRED